MKIMRHEVAGKPSETIDGHDWHRAGKVGNYVQWELVAHPVPDLTIGYPDQVEIAVGNQLRLAYAKFEVARERVEELTPTEVGEAIAAMSSFSLVATEVLSEYMRVLSETIRAFSGLWSRS